MLIKPLTKEDVAGIMSVSLRTVANWMANGTLPPWTYIGRRVYWHPDQFQDWLSEQLNPVRPDDGTALAAQAPPISAQPCKRGRPMRSGRT